MKWDAGLYDSTHGPQIDAGMELIGMASINAHDAILDVGCGTGRLTRELARRAHKGVVVGIDPSPEMLDKARAAASESGNITLMNIAAQEMAFSDEFDVVYSNSALQWVKEQEDVIARSWKALRKGGKIAVQLPAKDFCWAMMDNIWSAVSALGLTAEYEKMDSPWRFPLKQEMEGYLADAGFKNVDVFYRDYSLVFASINDVLGWGESAGLRPFLAPLNAKKQERFKYAFAMGFENYRTEKGIEFPFRRLFTVAEK